MINGSGARNYEVPDLNNGSKVVQMDGVTHDNTFYDMHIVDYRKWCSEREWLYTII